MKIEELDLGSEIYLGSWSWRGLRARADIVWFKTSYNNTFMMKNYIKAVPFDSPEELNPNETRRNNGTNFYPFSNMHQWLNGSGTDWFKPAHEYDTNSYCMPDDFGFLTRFDEQDLAALEEIEICCAVPDGFKRTYGSKYNLKTKVFLPSLDELGVFAEDCPDEGERFGIYENAYFEETTLTRSPVGLAKVSFVEYGESQSPVWCREEQKIKPCICLKGDLEVERAQGQEVYCLKTETKSCDDLVELLSVG